MKVHELKTVQPYFNQVAYGQKRFELRKNDPCIYRSEIDYPATI